MVSSSRSRRRRKANHSPDWSELPPDLTMKILQNLCPAELLERAQMVCKTWRNMSKDPSLWRSIDCFRFELDRRDEMTMRAVDLSCGQLVYAKLDREKLLQYTADRAPQLRRLEISFYRSNLDTEAVGKLPLLEELHMHCRLLPTVKVLKIIGSCCPELKSLKIDYSYAEEKTHDDKETQAITMPRLRHLEIDGDELKKSWLTAILEGCPQLESLKLRNGDHRKSVQTLAKLYPAVKIETADYTMPQRVKHCGFSSGSQELIVPWPGNSSSGGMKVQVVRVRKLK